MRTRLLALAAACLTAGGINAAPLKDLTPATAQEHVRAHLAAHPDAAASLEQAAGFQLTLDVSLVTYRVAPDGMPDQLLVQYVVTEAPTADQQTAAAVALARFLDDVLGQGSPPLLSAADLQSLRVRYRFQPVVRSEPVYWPQFTPAISFGGPWVSYSAGPIYFTWYNGHPFAVGEYRFAYNPLYYLYPSAFYSYWATWPYRPYSAYAPHYSPNAYWGYWGTYPPNGWAYPTGRPVYYLPPALIQTDRPSAETSFARGFTAYWDGELTTAATAFEAAVAAEPRNVRSWYYLALTRRAQGRESAATEAARIGAATRRMYEDKGLGTALERVQGPARELLTTAERGITDDRQARAILEKMPAVARR
jgi:hypothetical protein